METASMVDLFMEAKRAKGLAASTLSTYQYRLSQFQQAYPRLPTGPEEIEAFLDHPEWSSASRETSYRLIRSFYLWLIKRRHLRADENPLDLVEAPKLERKIPRILSVEQLRRVVQVSKAPLERSLILTLIDSMCRIGELVGLTKDDIVGNALRVSGKTGERMVPLSPQVRGFLEELPTFHLFPRHERLALGRGGRPQPPIVDEPASVWSLRKRVIQVLKRSGLKKPKLGPHLLRHSAATRYIDNGGDVVSLSKILGHTTTRMTERYVNLSTAALQRKHLEFGALSSLMSLEPATPEAELPRLTLPAEALSNKYYGPDDFVQLRFVSDKKPSRIFYYLRAILEDRRVQVARLGTDLPLSIVDGTKLAVERENERRRALDASLDGILVDPAEVRKSIAFLTDSGFDAPRETDHPIAWMMAIMWERGAASGQIKNMFDWFCLVVEEHQSETGIAMPPGDWGICICERTEERRAKGEETPVGNAHTCALACPSPDEGGPLRVDGEGRFRFRT